MKWIKQKIKDDGDNKYLYYRKGKYKVLKYYVCHWLNDYLPKPKKQFFLWKYGATKLKDTIVEDMETGEKTGALNSLLEIFNTLKGAENYIRKLENFNN